MKEKQIIIFLLLTIGLNLKAQMASVPVNFPSPNAVSLGIFGQIPVSPFTGTPNINIPLYEVSEGAIKVPISLSYNQSLVKVNNHAGWVGLGWNLNAGGVITRMVRDLPDECVHNNINKGYYYHSGELAASTWYSLSNIGTYLTNRYSIVNNYETMADEFSFNFLGYSGRFYLDPSGWHVVSDQNIKVEFDSSGGFSKVSQLSSTDRIKTACIHQSIMPESSTELFDIYFFKFTLITPDGMRYEFGGNTNAIEYSVSFVEQTNDRFIPTSWYLTKISSPEGKTVTFTYAPGHLVCSLANHYYAIKITNRSCTSYATPNIGSNPGGQLIFPVYLKTINFSNGSLDFQRSITTESRCNPYPIGTSGLSQPYYFWNFSEVQWEKLDSLAIRNSDGTTLKNFIFGYNNVATERLKLLWLQEREKSSYTFSYNSEALPDYLSYKTDHWGYYNNTDVNPITSNMVNLYLSSRQPDTTGIYLKAQVLKQITYPTGGYTIFDFEPNEYSQVVSIDRQRLSPVAKTKGGGLRIQKISTYDRDGTQAFAKEYFYESNYVYGTSLASYQSSGILGGKFCYNWASYPGTDIDGTAINCNIFSSGSLYPYGYNSEGSPIGYSEVMEMTSDNNANTTGYKKYKYTNFDNDIWNSSHYDDMALANTYSQQTEYAPFTSKALERGKLTSEAYFNKNNNIEKEIKYHYTRTGTDYIPMIDYSGINICAGDGSTVVALFSTAYKINSYSFLLDRKEETNYNNGQNPITEISNFIYNSFKNVSKITKTASDNSLLSTEYKYPNDYSAYSPYDDMVSHHIISPIIEQIEYKGSTMTHSQRTNYSYFQSNRIIAPSSLETRTNFYVYETRRVQSTDGTLTFDSQWLKAYETRLNYLDYDSKGNLLCMSKEKDSKTTFLWGYSQTYPVAKIENATLDEVKGIFGGAIPDLGTGCLSTSQISSLRSGLPQAHITTYTYSPLIGMTSATDPNGVTTYYEYDTFGRLKCIKDDGGRILKTYDYHFQTIRNASTYPYKI